MTYSVDKKDGDLDIQELVEQLKQFLKPNQELVVMLVTTDNEGEDYDVATTIEELADLHHALNCYADLLEGDDEGVECAVDDDDEADACLMHDPVSARRTLQ